MTTNQFNAVKLAEEVLDGRLDPEELPEPEWYLLLLAAGIFCNRVPAVHVSKRVLANADNRVGYFAS